MMRQKIVAGNWKMHKTITEGLALATEVMQIAKDELHQGPEVVLLPPFIHLQSVAHLAKGTDSVSLGAQNCHQQAQGAYTGEVSAGMLASVGCKYVLVGHSERRQYFHEKNALLAEKVNALLQNGLHPIYCCGETQAERESGAYEQVIEAQIEEGLFHLGEEQFAAVVIAYEPVWAIGTGLTASAAQAQEVHAFIRRLVTARYGAAIGDYLTILYGGSCKPGNAAELFAQPDIDGGLIGGAALVARDFIDICKAF